MEPEKEKWINDVLSSTNSLQRAEPGPFLFAKIQQRLNAAAAPVCVPTRTVWLVATSFALLLLLNWRVIHQPIAVKQVQSSDLTTFVRDMNLYPATDHPYGVWNEQNY